MDAETRLQRLAALAAEPDPARKRLVALGLVADRLRQDGLEPVLVGGAALEFYTAGGYATKDVDLALPNCPEVDATFVELGFEKDGRYWYRTDLDLLFEAPAPADLPGETAPRTVVEIEGLKVVVLGVEDLLIDRLRAWVHWKSEEDGRWARRLAALYSDRMDRIYLMERAGAIPEESAAMKTLLEESTT